MYTIDRRLHCGKDLTDIVLLGHSFAAQLLRKLPKRFPIAFDVIFLDAFVLNDGESLRDSLPPHYQALFDS